MQQATSKLDLGTVDGFSSLRKEILLVGMTAREAGAAPGYRLRMRWRRLTCRGVSLFRLPA